MLAASKDQLVAATKQESLGLRQKELEYFVERYSNITTQASIVAGFAFDALVELDITEEMEEKLVKEGNTWIQTSYYCAGSMAMALAMYTVCASSFATVYGHRLALQGPTGSVERAVAVMMKQRAVIFATFGLSLISLVLSAIAMAWIKMGDAAAIVSGIFGIFFLALLHKHQQMKGLFLIPQARTAAPPRPALPAKSSPSCPPAQEVMVTGDVRLNTGADVVDVSRLEAGFGPTASTSASAVAANADPRAEIFAREDRSMLHLGRDTGSSSGTEPLMRSSHAQR